MSLIVMLMKDNGGLDCMLPRCVFSLIYWLFINQIGPTSNTYQMKASHLCYRMVSIKELFRKVLKEVFNKEYKNKVFFNLHLFLIWIPE